MKNIDLEKEELRSELKGSFIKFIQFFFLSLSGRHFIISNPNGRDSHHITIARAFTEEFRIQKPGLGLIVNVPPGYGKSVMTSMWVAWCCAHYPDCNFLYISYSHVLAAAHSSFIIAFLLLLHRAAVALVYGDNGALRKNYLYGIK